VGLSLVTAPGDLLTLSEAKDHLRVLDANEDSLITSYVTAATASVERYLERALLTQRWQFTLDQFPCEDYICLPRPNLLDVVSVSYVDAAGATQTWATSEYVVITDTLPGEIALAYGKFWPQTRYQRNAVTIVYDAGYGPEPEDVPPEIVAAIKLTAGDLYRNREAFISSSTSTAVVLENPAVRALLDRHRYREAA